ncbi:hypothetical protein N7G274_008809 [Stereocaulon virgatum]|uniref:Uncharacterized protein n=1 Tax=Stereocaulon virgatum TaxID=373712 RepID=A0ABR3ZZ39_9LECA
MIVGLSCGGVISIDFVLSYPQLVSGLVVCAGGLGYLDHGNTPSEDASLKILDDFKAQVIESIAKSNVKILGDGPVAEEDRADARTGKRLYKWCKDIGARLIAGRGGGAFPSGGPK